MNSWLLLSLLTGHVIGDFYLQSTTVPLKMGIGL